VALTFSSSKQMTHIVFNLVYVEEIGVTKKSTKVLDQILILALSAELKTLN